MLIEREEAAAAAAAIRQKEPAWASEPRRLKGARARTYNTARARARAHSLANERRERARESKGTARSVYPSGKRRCARMPRETGDSAGERERARGERARLGFPLLLRRASVSAAAAAACRGRTSVLVPARATRRTHALAQSRAREHLRRFPPRDVVVVVVCCRLQPPRARVRTTFLRAFVTSAASVLARLCDEGRASFSIARKSTAGTEYIYNIKDSPLIVYTSVHSAISLVLPRCITANDCSLLSRFAAEKGVTHFGVCL